MNLHLSRKAAAPGASGVAAAIAIVTALLLWPAAGRAEDYLSHTVQRGDSLYTLSAHYLGTASRWGQLQRANHVTDPLRLVPGSRLRIPMSGMPTIAADATVTHLRGEVVARGADGATRALKVGDAIHEQDVVSVGAASFATVHTGDGSVLRVQPGSELRFDTLRRYVVVDRARSGFALRQGRVESIVTPQAEGSRFEVRTPLAVAGVRGTRFGVSVLPGAGVATDVIEGKVGVLPDGAPGNSRVKRDEVLIGADQGAVVQADGSADAPRALLASPDLSNLPAVFERPVLALPIAPLAGAVAWRVQIALDTQFEQVVRSELFTALPAKLAGLDDGDYQLSVRAIDQGGLIGRDSVRPIRIAARPEPPLAQSPELDARVVGPAVTLVCTDVPGATGYVLQLGADAHFDERADAATVKTIALDSCRHTIADAPLGDGWWRVATVVKDARGATRRGPFGDASRYTVIPKPAQPQAGEDDSGAVVLRWSGEPGDRFELQAATDLGFGAIVQTLQLDTPRARLELPPGHVYYLRLRSWDKNGFSAGYSEPKRVEVKATLRSGDGKPVKDGSGTVVEMR